MSSHVRRPRRKRPGGILVILAASMVVIIAAATLVVDSGSAIASKTHQQAAADAGALAAAMALLPADSNEDLARAEAVNLVAQNEFTISGDNVSFWTHSSGRKAVTVSWVQQTPAYFSKFFGQTTIPVPVTSSAILGELGSIPNGVVPFAVPSYEDEAGDWWVLSSTTPGDYRRMTDDPPTEMVLKLDAQANHAGNFLALALDGSGGNLYRDAINYGAQTHLEVGDQVFTQTGNMIGPTKQGLADRLAREGGADVVVPLISKTEWDAALGHTKVTIIGFVTAHINSVNGQGVITATFQSKVYPGDPTLGNGAGAGGLAPLLIDGER